MKTVLFLTGTRADFGKIKPLMQILESNDEYRVQVFATGMHMHQKYGFTLKEVEKAGFANIFPYINFTSESSMDLTLAKTIEGLSSYIREYPVDLIIVHGDRVETLAGAIVGSLNNILVAHIEGGELSGTIDELIRHAVSKLSHIHFVCNEEAKKRLLQMGEREDAIFVIGSPDIDIMFSPGLPLLREVLTYYEIPFNVYGVVMFHPVTTEYESMYAYANQMIDALIESNLNYVVIYPNNDLGSHYITDAFGKFQGRLNFKVLPSLRFEYFLTLLKNSMFMLGNSSAGIREAPGFGVPTVNVGTRQLNRSFAPGIINVDYSKVSILEGINKAINREEIAITHEFGNGDSVQLFMKAISSTDFWKLSKQKTFVDQMKIAEVNQ